MHTVKVRPSEHAKVDFEAWVWFWVDLDLKSYVIAHVL